MLLDTTFQAFIERFFFDIISNKYDFAFPDFSIHPWASDLNFAIGSYGLKYNFMGFTFQIQYALDSINLVATQEQ